MAVTTNSDAPKGIREQRRVELAEKIELTALEMFAADTFEGVTGDDIAAAVGISRRTVFRYFPGGKEEIVLQDLRRRLAELRDDLEGRPPVERPLEALRHALMGLAAGYEGDRDLAAMRGRILIGAPSLSARFSGEQTALTAAIVQMIAARMHVDPSADPRPAVIVAASFGAFQVAFGRWLFQGGDLRVAAGECLDMVNSGLGSIETRRDPAVVG